MARLLCVSVLLSSHLFAATYYVSTSGLDANPGSQAQPWRTIGKGVATAVGGDTVIVTAGSYGEIVSTVRSGSSGNRITIRGQGLPVTKSFDILHDYITIDGFEMTAKNDVWTVTMEGNYCELLNNVIHDTGAAWGIVSIPVESTGCLIKGNRFYSSQSASNDLPVIILNGSNHIVEDNELGPLKDTDTFRAWGNNHIIRRNYIHDVTYTPGSDAHVDVIQTFNCCSDNLIFEKNLVVNFDGQLGMTETNGPGTGNWHVRNNVYVNVTLQMNVGIPDFRFYNNTLYNVGGGNNIIMFLYDAVGKSNFNNAVIKNNIFVPASSITSYGNVMAVGSSGTNVQISNNMVTRVSTWGTMTGFSDTNGINGGNPLFADLGANNFHLTTGSPAINTGTAITGLTDDYDSNARSSPFDIGAFEFSVGGSSIPTVTTSAASSITSTTATGNGNVTSDGGATITARGVCWSTSADPTTGGTCATSGGTTGAFTASMTGLSSSTLYHYRAYATNSVGTSYGSDTTFTTSSGASSAHRRPAGTIRFGGKVQ